MTKQEMFRRGEEHAKAGRRCTPFECQQVDKELFAAMKTQPKPAKWYAAMRGAFNRGWDAQYAKMVMSDDGWAEAEAS